MEGLKQGDRVICTGRDVRRGEFMYYAKSKDYVRRAVVFFDGNRQPSNVKADQLQREKQKASSVQLSMDLAKTFVSCYTDTAYAGKFVETLHAMRKEIEAQL